MVGDEGEEVEEGTMTGGEDTMIDEGVVEDMRTEVRFVSLLSLSQNRFHKPLITAAALPLVEIY